MGIGAYFGSITVKIQRENKSRMKTFGDLFSELFDSKTLEQKEFVRSRLFVQFQRTDEDRGLECLSISSATKLAASIIRSERRLFNERFSLSASDDELPSLEPYEIDTQAPEEETDSHLTGDQSKKLFKKKSQEQCEQSKTDDPSFTESGNEAEYEDKDKKVTTDKTVMNKQDDIEPNKHDTETDEVENDRVGAGPGSRVVNVPLKALKRFVKPFTIIMHRLTTAEIRTWTGKTKAADNVDEGNKMMPLSLKRQRNLQKSPKRRGRPR